MKKTLVQKILTLFLGGFFVFATTAGATTTTLTWTDDSTYAPSKFGNTITYTLSFDDDPSSTIGGFDTYEDAIFTIDTTADISTNGPNGCEWYAGWFLFKFDMGEKGIISSLSYTGPAAGPWSIDNYGVNVLKAGGGYGALAHDGFTGFYVTSLAEGLPADNIEQGALLTGGVDHSFEFDFTLPEGVQPKLDMMPFQASFYCDNPLPSGNYKVNRLSEELSIPDPAAVFLLGPACLIGFAGLRRKFKM